MMNNKRKYMKKIVCIVCCLFILACGTDCLAGKKVNTRFLEKIFDSDVFGDIGGPLFNGTISLGFGTVACVSGYACIKQTQAALKKDIPTLKRIVHGSGALGLGTLAILCTIPTVFYGNWTLKMISYNIQALRTKRPQKL